MIGGPGEGGIELYAIGHDGEQGILILESNVDLCGAYCVWKNQ